MTGENNLSKAQIEEMNALSMSRSRYEIHRRAVAIGDLANAIIHLARARTYFAETEGNSPIVRRLDGVRRSISAITPSYSKNLNRGGAEAQRT